jgi:Protein of unknown function (DUF732)
MKTVLATAITIAALTLSSGVAHADETDQEFIGYVVFHGQSPASGVSQRDWQTSMIEAGHELCARLGAGESRNSIIRDEVSRLGSDVGHEVGTLIDAAETFYCPQFKY